MLGIRCIPPHFAINIRALITKTLTYVLNYNVTFIKRIKMLFSCMLPDVFKVEPDVEDIVSSDR